MDLEFVAANVLGRSWFHDSEDLNNNKLSQSCRSPYTCHKGLSNDFNSNNDNTNIKYIGFNSTSKFGDITGFPMLGLLHNQSVVSSHRMPMDFSRYLLSISPPKSSGFETTSYSPQHSDGHTGFSPSTFQNIDCSSCQLSPSQNKTHDNNNNNANLNNRRNRLLKSIIIKSDSSPDIERDGSSPDSPYSPGRLVKKVSFADHKGFALAQVRLVKEGPDEPPHLNPDILSSLTEGACADITCKPPIKLCFPQPASDYVAFRDKVSTNLVMLENVMLKDYTVEGTIKVKNINFEKHVFVRMSLNDWETYEDTEATYVPGLGLGFSDAHDTFSFKIDIPPNFDTSKKIQFAVCFEENGHEHWDSNGGLNYCIVSENYDFSKTPSCSPRWLPDKCTETWSEFSVSQLTDSTTPYY